MKRNWGKWCALGLCVLLCAAILGGCQLDDTKYTHIEGKLQVEAEAALDGLVRALRSADMETAQQYMDLASLETGGIDFTSETYKPLATEMFSRLDYEVISAEKVDESNITLHVKIKAVDMKPVMASWIQNLMKKAVELGGTAAELSEQEQMQLAMDGLLEAVRQSGGKMMETEVDVNVTKTDMDWKVQADRAFANALLGGLMDAAEGIENSLG